MISYLCCFEILLALLDKMHFDKSCTTLLAKTHAKKVEFTVCQQKHKKKELKWLTNRNYNCFFLIDWNGMFVTLS